VDGTELDARGWSPYPGLHRHSGFNYIIRSGWQMLALWKIKNASPRNILDGKYSRAFRFLRIAAKKIFLRIVPPITIRIVLGTCQRRRQVGETGNPIVE